VLAALRDLLADDGVGDVAREVRDALDDRLRRA
jgi:hypothetical protein